MEYKGATIIAILFFGLLFVGALFMIQPDPPPAEEEVIPGGNARVSGTIPDPQPENIDADADKEYTKTKSGLKYRVLRKSDKLKATPKDAVAVAYEGWLDNQQIFDSSYAKKPSYFSVEPPWAVIEGWKEALTLIGEGGMVELEIPPHLGYGAMGYPPKIPKDATLWFKLEILKVFKSTEDE